MIFLDSQISVERVSSASDNLLQRWYFNQFPEPITTRQDNRRFPNVTLGTIEALQGDSAF